MGNSKPQNCSYGEAIEILYAQEVAAGLAA